MCRDLVKGPKLSLVHILYLITIPINFIGIEPLPRMWINVDITFSSSKLHRPYIFHIHSLERLDTSEEFYKKYSLESNLHPLGRQVLPGAFK